MLHAFLISICVLHFADWLPLLITGGSVDTQSPSGCIHRERDLRTHFSHCVGHQFSAWGITVHFFRELLMCRIAVRRISHYKLLIWKCFVILGAFASIYIPLRMYGRGSHWPDFHAIWYWGLLRKSVEKFQVWLKSDNNVGHLTWGAKYADIADSSTKYSVTGQPWKGNPILRFHGKAQRFYIVDSDV